MASGKNRLFINNVGVKKELLNGIQPKLAEITGLRQSTISKVITGKPVKDDTKKLVADALIILFTDAIVIV